MSKISNNIKLFAFDLDGTLYLGEKLIEGAVDLICFLKKKYKVVFFTNNSTKTREEIYYKMKSLGFECNLDEVFTSSFATAKYLLESDIDNVFIIGSDGLRNEILDKGICIVDDDLAENLVVGLDLDFNYKKIKTAMSIIINKGKFIACNEDRSFPVGENKFMPACGAMVGAIVSTSNKNPDFVVGKPNTYILSKIEEEYEIEHHEILVVGDSYESDIMMAKNNTSNAILVNSKNNVNDRNILVMENLNKILRYLKDH